MHPLILFALFFIPGIKSTYLVKQELDDFSVKENAIVPISPPETSDLANSRREFENNKIMSYFKSNEETNGHLKSRYRKGYDLGFQNLEVLPYRRKHQYLSSKNINSKDLDISDGEHHRTYSATPSPSEFYKNSKGVKKEKDSKGKKLNKIKNSQHFDKHNDWQHKKKYNGYKKARSEEVMVKHYGKGKKYMKPEMKEREDLVSSLEGIESHRDAEKLIDDYARNQVSSDKRKRYERVKREQDSVESDESFHGGEYDTINSDEDKSDESLEDYEKRIIAHLFEGATVGNDNLQPYKDFIDVEIKKNENDGSVPVVEEVISKTNAYVSCNDGGDLLGCELKKQQDRQNQENHENNINKMEEPNYNHEIDEAAWLKALEDEIINSGIDIQHHQK